MSFAIFQPADAFVVFAQFVEELLEVGLDQFNVPLERAEQPVVEE